MELERLAIKDLLLITPKRFGDARGYFMEAFRQDVFTEHAGAHVFVQDNQSLSAERGTVRGLHYQTEPRAQGKLVRCVAGAILDVAVDIRAGSPTFGQHVAVELDEDSGRLLWVPPGFAHGFCTLTDNAVVCYKVTNYYSPDHDRGLLWNDPALGIDWPVVAGAAILSAKDQQHPGLAQLDPLPAGGG
jgi:dTDP-4-dehydrorhamnose 3,5-epimerase